MSIQCLQIPHYSKSKANHLLNVMKNVRIEQEVKVANFLFSRQIRSNDSESTNSFYDAQKQSLAENESMRITNYSSFEEIDDDNKENSKFDISSQGFNAFSEINNVNYITKSDEGLDNYDIDHLLLSFEEFPRENREVQEFGFF